MRKVFSFCGDEQFTFVLTISEWLSLPFPDVTDRPFPAYSQYSSGFRYTIVVRKFSQQRSVNYLINCSQTTRFA